MWSGPKVDLFATPSPHFCWWAIAQREVDELSISLWTMALSPFFPPPKKKKVTTFVICQMPHHWMGTRALKKTLVLKKTFLWTHTLLGSLSKRQNDIKGQCFYIHCGGVWLYIFCPFSGIRYHRTQFYLFQSSFSSNKSFVSNKAALRYHWALFYSFFQSSSPPNTCSFSHFYSPFQLSLPSYKSSFSLFYPTCNYLLPLTYPTSPCIISLSIIFCL